MPKPPAAWEAVVHAALAAVGRKAAWPGAARLLLERDVWRALVGLDATQLAAATLKAVRAYTAMPGFDPGAAERRRRGLAQGPRVWGDW